jgi:hypothetical protein
MHTQPCLHLADYGPYGAVRQCAPVDHCMAPSMSAGQLGRVQAELQEGGSIQLLEALLQLVLDQQQQAPLQRRCLPAGCAPCA